MPNKQELDDCYMQVAIAHSKLSKAKRKQVGACLVTTQGSTVAGVNGMPSGMSNICEDAAWTTKEEVIHAELNSIIRCAKNGISCIGGTMYVTLSPCLKCAALLIQAGVKEVIYLEEYRDRSGIELLNQSGIIVRQYSQGGA